MPQNRKQQTQAIAIAQRRLKQTFANYKQVNKKYKLGTKEGMKKIKKAFFAWDRAFEDFQKIYNK